jgi:N-methylhydantoinase A/oxoprolinase/acetone carboxylase beta subunit
MPAGRRRGGEDGHHRRHQRAARAQGRAHAARITRGFGDALRIGYQARPDIFDRDIVLPELLYERVVEIDERVTADGDGAAPARPRRRPRGLQEASTPASARVAIVLMHGWRWTAHERRWPRSRGRSASPRSPPATASGR